MSSAPYLAKSAIISLSHSLSLEVVAEGVETEDQVKYLIEHGCDSIQGYYFSRPLPAKIVSGLLPRVAGVSELNKTA